ncbi:MAG: tetratricopeptide repeat protein [Polyangiaceae bacterium]|nr:tetratricopeptide repeat protein [Polyangiaceae bacterium]
MPRRALAASAALATVLGSTPALATPTARFDDPVQRPLPPSPPPASRAPAPTPAPAESWATRAARELVDRAAQARSGGDAGRALAWLTEAIRMDPSYGPAYFALGSLREALGDVGEAERVYDLALRLPSATAEALARRAELRRRRGDSRGALSDLAASLERAPDHVERLQTLAGWYVEASNWIGALSSLRRVLVLLEQRDASSAEVRDARTRVRALMVLAAELDPVRVGGHDHPHWVRRTFARVAERSP